MAERDKDTLSATVRAIMAERRRELGEPPTPEELLDYRHGRLEEAERRELERKIDAFPEAARALADLAAFPEVAAAPGVRDISDEELTAGWESFRRRLEALPAPRPSQEAPPEPVELAEPVEPASGRPAREFRRRPGLVLLAAAALAGVVVGLGAGWRLGRLVPDEEPESAINVTIAQLSPRGAAEERAPEAPKEVEISGFSEEIVLVLTFFEAVDRPGYAVEIRDHAGEVVWRRGGLRPSQEGTFQLGLRRRLLPPGRYHLVLFGQTEEGEIPLADYDVRLTPEQNP